MKNGPIKETIRDFIIKNYLKGLGGHKLGDNDSFMEQGIIDSVGVIELIAFIQRTYKIKTEVTEIVPDNLDTLNNLERYITRKLGRS